MFTSKHILSALLYLSLLLAYVYIPFIVPLGNHVHLSTDGLNRNICKYNKFNDIECYCLCIPRKKPVPPSVVTYWPASWSSRSCQTGIGCQCFFFKFFIFSRHRFLSCEFPHSCIKLVWNSWLLPLTASESCPPTKLSAMYIFCCQTSFVYSPSFLSYCMHLVNQVMTLLLTRARLAYYWNLS